MSDLVEKKESVNEYKKLLRYFEEEGKRINKNSQGHKWLGAVWNMVIPDLTIFTECIHVFNPNDFRIIINKKKPNSQKYQIHLPLNNEGLTNWGRHIRRTCVIETYSIIEHYFWCLKSDLQLEVKGKMHTIEKDLDDVISMLGDQEEIKAKLINTKEKCRRTKPDLLTLMFEVLKKYKVSGGVRKKWRNFFNQFRIIRNSIHNNMIAQNDYDDFPNDWYPYQVIKNKPISPTCDVLMKMTEKCIDFFKEVNL